MKPQLRKGPRGPHHLAFLSGARHAKAFRNALRVGVFVASLMPVVAHAFTGGSILAEVLGWDPGERKVFVALHHRDESGSPPLLVYFKLDGSTDSLGTIVPWSLDDDPDDPTRDQKWKSIRKRLKPLIELEAGSIPKSKRITETTRVADLESDRDITRYRVDFNWLPTFWDGRGIEVETYSDPWVNFHRLYSIPGRQERLGILAFVGNPRGGGDETQVPILIRPASHAPIKVRWRWWEP